MTRASEPSTAAPCATQGPLAETVTDESSWDDGGLMSEPRSFDGVILEEEQDSGADPLVESDSPHPHCQSDRFGSRGDCKAESSGYEIGSLHKHMSEDIVLNFVGARKLAAGGWADVTGNLGDESVQEGGGLPTTCSVSDVELEDLPNLANVFEDDDFEHLRQHVVDFDALGIYYRINDDGEGEIVHGEQRPFRPEVARDGPMHQPLPRAELEDFLNQYARAREEADVSGDEALQQHPERVNCMDFDAMGIYYRINSDGEGEIVQGEPRLGPRPEVAHAGPAHHRLPAVVADRRRHEPRRPGGARRQRPHHRGREVHPTARVDSIDFRLAGLLGNVGHASSSEGADSEESDSEGADGEESDSEVDDGEGADSEGSGGSEASGGSLWSELRHLEQGCRLSGPAGAALRALMRPEG